MNEASGEWQIVVFLLDNQYFAIEVDRTREILRCPAVRPVPQAHAAMVGITAIRGALIPLLDVRVYLGMESNAGLEQSKLIVAELKGTKLGLIVDAVDRIYSIGSSDLDSSLSGTFLGEDVSHVIKRENINILLLDYEKIFQSVDLCVPQAYSEENDVCAGVEGDSATA